MTSYCSVTLDCEVHVLHDDHHHLLSLDFRRYPSTWTPTCVCSSSLLVTFGSNLFVTGRGLLGLILVTLFVVVIAFTFTRALHDALQHVRFLVLDDSSSSAVYCDIASVDFLGCSIGLLIRLHSVLPLPSRTLAVKLYHGVAAIFLQLAYLSLLANKQGRPVTEPLALESAPPCSVSVHCLPEHHELRLHIRPRSWRRARRLCGFLVCLLGFLDAILKTDWLSSTFSASVVEISSVLLAIVCSQTRIAASHAGLDLACGLV